MKKSTQRVSTTDTRLFGKIRAFNARRVTVAAGDGATYYKLFLVVFAKDGGVFVQFPYIGDCAGIVANLDLAQTGSIAREWRLAEVGHLTSHVTKFVHHVDGEAHFSQDGKVRTLVRRQSFRLDGPIGHLFQFSAHELTGFERFSDRDERKSRPAVMFTFKSMPDGVTVVADWSRIEQFQRIVLPGSREVGPMITLRGRTEPTADDMTLLVNPLHPRNPKHALTLVAQASALPAGHDGPSLVLIGGWDPHEVGDATQRVHHTGALLASYPTKNVDALYGKMPTIDLQPRIIEGTA